MKKIIFSFNTTLAFLFVLIFAVSCSSNKETDNKTSETDTSSELLSNKTEAGNEIDYAETNQAEEETLAEETPTKVNNTEDEKNNKKAETKKTATSKIIDSSPKRNQETASTPTKTTPKRELRNAEKVGTTPKKVEKPTKPFSHDSWNVLLQKYVSSTGKVNYAGFKKDKAKLGAYLKLLSANEPSGKSRNDQMAYWINAYNAFTVGLIADNYPVSSILKLDNGKTWMVKRITIGGKKYSLEDIEKKVLIGKFKEPRIHFAINCAAKSCPPLKNRAWKGSSLNSDLDRASKNFINNTSYNEIEKKTAKLSQIFNWYKGDFSDVNAFINKYANTQITGKTKVSFNEYNWNLNN